MKKIVFLFSLVLFVTIAQAQTFQVNDVRIGEPTFSYLDFEFWQDGSRVTFQDENNLGWVGQMNNLTGDFVTSSGRDFQFDNSLTPITQSFNGPEWGYRQGGADVFFTKQAGSNRHIGKASWNGSGYTVTDLSASLSGNRFGALAAKNPTDVQTNLIYVRGSILSGSTINWSPATNPVVDTPIPYGANSSSGPRFIDGEQALLTNDTVNGITQIFKYDLVTSALTQLTFDDGNKIDAFTWIAPDFDGSRLLFCTVGDTTLRLYKEINGSFVKQYDIQLPDISYRYYFSAEPFVFKNKSYLFLCAAREKFIPGSQSNSKPADVWLVGLGRNSPAFRKVSDNRTALRLDPEVFITPTEAYIYYYEYKQNGDVHPVAMHKTSSGLGRFPLGKSTPFDFDGDGKSDVSVFRQSEGVWYSLNSTQGFQASQFGIATDKITPADYDGDGKTDVAVFRDGVWYWLASSNNSFNAYQFGIASDIPVAADFSGDGRSELAVYRLGIWYTLNLVNNQFQAVQFGAAADKPVPADFDGDGKTDVAVYRNGDWYWLRSSDNGFQSVNFGIASDQPVIGDYDGDGQADQTVFRSGVWYVLGSRQGFSAVQFGITGDVPVAADYDGDERTDIAVFRDGAWYWLNSSNNQFNNVQWGLPNDKPIPAAFVP